MITMATNIQYSDLSDFLAKHTVKSGSTNENKEITHTRIGNTDLNIYGGSYHIDKDEYIY